MDATYISSFLPFVLKYTSWENLSEEAVRKGKFNNLAQHCIFDFINIPNNSDANDKIPQDHS